MGPDAYIHPVSFLTSVFVLSPLSVGPVMLATMRFRDGSGDMSTLFIGYARYVPVMLIGLMMTAGLTVVSGVVGFAAGVGMGLGPPMSIAVTAVLFLGALGALVYLGLRVCLATMVCVDPWGPRLGPINSLIASWRMTEGRILTLFAVGVVVGFIALVCFVLLILPGIFYAMPMAACVMGVVYALVAHDSALVPMVPYESCPFCRQPLADPGADVCPGCGAHVPHPRGAAGRDSEQRHLP